MTEAIFGLIGVFIGSAITWLQSYLTQKKEVDKSARYLAIRVVCILDKYLEDCTSVVKDDGLSYGQRSEDGCLAPQVKIPETIKYPEDIDWKSIDHELMFKLLSFPAEIEDGNRIIYATEEIAVPPDYQEWFDERKFRYCQFGLMAYYYSNELSEKYGIKKKVYNNWDPLEDLSNHLKIVATRRHFRIEELNEMVRRTLG